MEPLRLAVPSAVLKHQGEDLIISSGHALPPVTRCIGDWLVQWATRTPDRTFVAERKLDGSWRRESYAASLRAAESLGSSLLELGATATRPVMVLADNGVDHALLQLGAMHAGVPVAPISTAYALASVDFGRLREVARTLAPGVIVVDDIQRYGRALDALAQEGLGNVPVITIDGQAGRGSTPVATLSARAPSAALQEAFARVGPDTVNKILFTSGSTGAPKGVVNTHRMLCSNQEAIATLWPFLSNEPPVTLDWLPWSHTFGSNHNVNMIIRNGGTLYVDGGRPAPGLVDLTVKNLRDVNPSIYFNVPRGYDLLLPFLEGDTALRTAFFSSLRALFYAAAALPPKTRARMEAVAKAAGREDVFITSAWGSTETSPLSTSAYFHTSTPAIIGLPAPGTDIKLAAPEGGSMRREIRVRGPNVTAGYWRPGGEVVPALKDADGFLPTGDAGRLVDERHPEAGIVFEGRIGENFKLSSGTWVSVGQLRVALLDACAPLLQDAVVTGHDRDALGVLLFVSPAAKQAAPDELRGRLLGMLREHNAQNPASSHRVARALVLAEPPSLDAGETTDKGYINQRRVLDRRATDVERLYAVTPDAEVLRP